MTGRKRGAQLPPRGDFARDFLRRKRPPPRCGALALLLLVAALLTVARADPRPDPDFRPVVADPAYPPGAGPVICVDEAHHNFHRISGLFKAFGDLLTADGYRAKASSAVFDREVPNDCQVLVIANAQPSDAPWDDYPYPTPSAFDAAEVHTLATWVNLGGRLLLIADHMPFPGAAASLAGAFGCTFNDGFAVQAFHTEEEGRALFTAPTIFSLDAGSLRAHPVTRGQAPGASVTRIATFAGQAFRCADDAAPLLVLPRDFVSLMPQKPWKFTLQTLSVPVGGWLQGATLGFGSGRVAVFGEAGMFTAQITDDGRKMGMNAPGAEQNTRFVRNLIQWLAKP